MRISQEIGKDGIVIPKLLQSSGDPELDRKALEAVSRRKYEASEDGDRTTIRMTSQQEEADFQRTGISPSTTTIRRGYDRS